jgi:hypothetical protein
MILTFFAYFLVVFSSVFSQTTFNTSVVLKDAEPTVLKVKLPKWKPKTVDQSYDPKIVDWNSVISGCRATCRFDRRLCNFYVRAAAHDSLTLSEGFGGADGSVLLTADEITRPENRYDSWAFLLSQNALALAKRYNTSVADIIAVCGAVATEFSGGPSIISSSVGTPFFVGRYDTTDPNPNKKLPGSNINLQAFAEFAASRSLTLAEMTALMGSHSLIDERGCERTYGTQCDPNTEPCTDLRMFRWSNVYYKDVCSPNIRINDPPIRNTQPFKTLKQLRTHNLCKFTSSQLRAREIAIFDNEIKTLLGTLSEDSLVIDLDTELERVSWFSRNLTSRQWMYTVHDAWMGLACQNRVGANANNTAIRNAMNTFSNNVSAWDIHYITAYKKMVNLGASWALGDPFAITGDECPSGYVSAVKGLVVDCSKCTETFRRNGTFNCPSNCKCVTGLSNSVRFFTAIV